MYQRMAEHEPFKLILKKDEPKEHVYEIPRGIVICMSHARLELRMAECRPARKGYGIYETPRKPKLINDLSYFPLYVATDGSIQGYFWIYKHSFDKKRKKHAFNYSDWTSIKGGIPIKYSSKWRYYPPGKPDGSLNK